MSKINEMDFSEIEKNAEKAEKLLETEEKKISSSSKPLKIELKADDSDMKAALVSIINSRDLKYSDLINYFGNNLTEKEKTKNGKELSETELALKKVRKGGNVIVALRVRNSMNDKTFYDLCKFLDIDIILRDKDGNETIV